jgi:hypothetical protein
LKTPDFVACGSCKRRLDPSTHLVASVPKETPRERITEIVAREYRAFTVQCPDCHHYTMVSPTQTRILMIPANALYDWFSDQLAKARDILIDGRMSLTDRWNRAAPELRLLSPVGPGASDPIIKRIYAMVTSQEPFFTPADVDELLRLIDEALIILERERGAR